MSTAKAILKVRSNVVTNVRDESKGFVLESFGCRLVLETRIEG